jgi:predicted transcriptional regulator
MAECDLAYNVDKGEEYTGFKELYSDSMMKKRHISEHGHVYDIADFKDSKHVLLFLERLEKESSPEVIMTTGSFFSMNKRLQKQVVKRLKILAEKGTVSLYAGEKDIDNLFIGSNVRVKIFNRKKRFIPHFIKTKHQYNFALPHTEQKLVRVDINSDTFDPQTAERILKYFDNLVADLDKAIELDNKS